MKLDLSKYSSYKTVYSIIDSTVPNVIKADKTTPFSFIEFLKYFNVKNQNGLDLYNQYLRDWYVASNDSNSKTLEQITKEAYVKLLQEIRLNYLTPDEERIIGQLDYNNPLELEVAIPFFVDKLKEIIIFFSNEREYNKQNMLRWKLRGSKKYLEKSIREFIIRNYAKKNDIKYQSNKYNIDLLNKDVKIEIRPTYDYNNYFEDSKIYEPNLALFLDQTTSSNLSSYSDYNLSSIPNQQNEAAIVAKYLNSDIFLLSSTPSLSSVEISRLIKNNRTEFSPNHNVTSAIALSSNKNNLKYIETIGELFDIRRLLSSNLLSIENYYFPDYNKINLSATNFQSTPLSNFSGNLFEITPISAMPTYVGDKILLNDYKYYNSDYLIQTEFIDYLKYTNVNGELNNKPLTDKILKRFFPYANSVEKNDYVIGIQSYENSLNYWETSEIWKNSDVYEKYVNNTLNRTQREYDLFFNDDKSLYQSVKDIYGNNFSLYKRNKFEASPYALLGLTNGEQLSAWSSGLDTYIIGLSGLGGLSAYDVNNDGVLGIDEISLSAQGYIGTELYLDDISLPPDCLINIKFDYASDLFIINQAVTTPSANTLNFSEVPYRNNADYTKTPSIDLSEYNLDMSIYNKKDSYGTVYVQDLYKTSVRPLSTLVISQNLSNDLVIDINSNVKHLDIFYNLLLVKTKDYLIYSKINYDYDDNIITLNSFNNNIHYPEDNLNKLSTPFKDNELNSCIVCQISAYDFNNVINLIPKIYNIDINSNNYYISYDGIDELNEFTSYNKAFRLKEINYPIITKNSLTKELVVTTFAKDHAENFIIFTYVFDTTNKYYTLKSSKVYYPENLTLTFETLSAISNNFELSAYTTTITDSLTANDEVYWETNVKSLFTVDEKLHRNRIEPIYVNNTVKYINKQQERINISEVILTLGLLNSDYLTPDTASNTILGVAPQSKKLARNILIDLDFQFLKILYPYSFAENIYKCIISVNNVKYIYDSDFNLAGGDYTSEYIYSPFNKTNSISLSAIDNNIQIDLYSNYAPYKNTIYLNAETNNTSYQNKYYGFNLVEAATYSKEDRNYLDLYIESINPKYLFKKTLAL